MKKILLKINSVFLILQLLIFPLSFSLVNAQEVPSKNELTNSITEQAQTGIEESLNASDDTDEQNSHEESAPESEIDVVNTGDNTEIDSDTSSETETHVANNNTAEVNQTVNATANTGNNEANGNISFGGNAGVIVTGDAAVVSNSQTQANSNKTAVNNSPQQQNNSTNIGNTGNSLTSSSSTDMSQLTMVNNNNTTTINQTTNAHANTGGNTADKNIAIGGGHAGLIITGNAYTGVNSLTTANGTVTLIGGVNNGNGPGAGASVMIANTGNDSFFSNLYRSSSHTNVYNNNYASVHQSCGAAIPGVNHRSACIANTGGNNSSGNIGTNGSAGVIQTGNALVYAGLFTATNSNKTAVRNSTHGHNRDTDIVNTGDDSTYDLTSEADSETKTTNNNTALVNQTIDAIANTGNNSANGNISFGGDAGVIYTGDAVVIAEASATLNQNKTKIDTSEDKDDKKKNDDKDTTAFAPCPAAVDKVNIVNTGDDLDVDTSSTQNTSIDVNNTNNARINQSVNALSSTGDNNADKNIGKTAIFTGDAGVNVGLDVDANVNKTVLSDCLITKAKPTPSPTKTLTPTPTATVTPTPTDAATPTPTPEEDGNGEEDEDEENGAVTANGDDQGFKGGVPLEEAGEVLGAAVSKLPVTGAEQTVMILLTAAVMLITGDYLRKYKSNFASS